MLYRVTGPAGSGKTEYLYGVLAEAFRHGESCVWITPEQQSFQTEREILNRLGNTSCERVEVMTFGDMTDRVARRYGGTAVTYLEQGAVFALLSVLAVRHKDELVEYASSAEDPGFLSGLYQLFKRLRSAMITPEQLTRIADGEEWTDRARLRGKLKDISILYQAYDAYFTEDMQDARNRLTRLSERLPDCPYFSGKIVILDGFYRFHEQEFAVLRRIFRQAKDVWCGFAMDDRELFSGIRSSANRLAEIAGGCTDISLPAFRRSADPSFRFLEEHLWSDGNPVYADPVPCIRLLRAGNPFEESHAAAARIMELVRSGMRYRDITVFVRGPEQYAGILDVVFRSAGIPYFYSEKAGISARPLIAFVCAALEMIATRFSLSAVRKYLKTGYSGMTAEESDLLLNYAESWSIRGNAWLDEKPWTRNPDGYRSGSMKEEQKAVLASVNHAREMFVFSILPLVRALKKPGKGEDREAPNVDRMLEALYDHLERCAASDRFVNTVNGMLARGEEEDARRESQIWGILVSIFDRLHEICGQEIMSVSRLLALFRLTADQFDVGTIPSSSDCVSIGDPTAMVPDAARAVFLLGCNEGVFPASGLGDTLFDEIETDQLNELRLPVADALDDRLTEERYYFYSAVLSASEYLFLSYPSGSVNGESRRPSFALARICSLFPRLEEESFRADPENLLYSASAACQIFPLLPSGPRKEEVRELLAVNGFRPREVASALFDPEAYAPQDAEAVRLSPSALERYRSCPFSYFGTEVLKLKEKRTYRFDSPEFGTIVHRVLETFVRNHTKKGAFLPPATPQELERETDRLLMQALEEAGLGKEAGGRFRHTCRNLSGLIRYAAANLSEEIQNGSFVPSGFEVGIGLGSPSGGNLPVVELETADGKKVYLCGSIDRVDQFRKDGITYVRVVDYKTYKKTLSLKMARAYGLDEQMLLYLMSYCKVGSGRGSPGEGEILEPAGVLYSTLDYPYLTVTGLESSEELERKKEKEFHLKRTGILLDDREILTAMDGSESKRYLPVSTFGPDRTVRSDNPNLLSPEQFRELFETMERQLKRDGERILEGRMDIRPVRPDQNHDACRFCPLKNACRFGGDTDDEPDEDETEGGGD